MILKLAESMDMTAASVCPMAVLWECYERRWISEEVYWPHFKFALGFGFGVDHD